VARARRRQTVTLTLAGDGENSSSQAQSKARSDRSGPLHRPVKARYGFSIDQCLLFHRVGIDALCRDRGGGGGFRLVAAMSVHPDFRSHTDSCLPQISQARWRTHRDRARRPEPRRAGKIASRKRIFCISRTAMVEGCLAGYRDAFCGSFTVLYHYTTLSTVILRFGPLVQGGIRPRRAHA